MQHVQNQVLDVARDFDEALNTDSSNRCLQKVMFRLYLRTSATATYLPMLCILLQLLGHWLILVRHICLEVPMQLQARCGNALLYLLQVDLVIKSDNHPLNTLVIRRLKIDRADPAVS